jgi:hypothetical protein
MKKDEEGKKRRRRRRTVTGKRCRKMRRGRGGG